ncbi:MAG: hypothetical protein PUK04_06360 [Bacteroidales bacterium]|nr:hypothetical protein [Bacteroidales bacterium]
MKMRIWHKWQTSWRPKIDKLCNAVNVNNRTREQVEHVRASVNSYCGVLAHGKNYHLRKELLGEKNKLRRIGYFDAAYAHFKPYGDLLVIRSE